MEFQWNKAILEDVSTLEGPPPLGRQSMVFTALKAIKPGKVPWPSGIVVEMLIACGSSTEDRIIALPNVVIHEKCIHLTETILTS